MIAREENDIRDSAIIHQDLNQAQFSPEVELSRSRSWLKPRVPRHEEVCRRRYSGRDPLYPHRSLHAPPAGQDHTPVDLDGTPDPRSPRPIFRQSHPPVHPWSAATIHARREAHRRPGPLAAAAQARGPALLAAHGRTTRDAPAASRGSRCRSARPSALAPGLPPPRTSPAAAGWPREARWFFGPLASPREATRGGTRGTCLFG